MLRAERDVVAAVIRQASALTVFAAAEPEPRFTWYNGSTLVTPTTDLHATEERRLDITTALHSGADEDWKTLFQYSSTLTLSKVEVWDLAEYRVVVDNDYGSNYTSLRLVQASKCTIWAISDFVLSLYHNCDSTTNFYDTTTTRLRRIIDMFIFYSRRIASNGSRRTRYVVVGS